MSAVRTTAQVPRSSPRGVRPAAQSDSVLASPGTRPSRGAEGLATLVSRSGWCPVWSLSHPLWCSRHLLWFSGASVSVTVEYGKGRQSALGAAPDHGAALVSVRSHPRAKSGRAAAFAACTADDPRGSRTHGTAAGPHSSLDQT